MTFQLLEAVAVLHRCVGARVTDGLWLALDLFKELFIKVTPETVTCLCEPITAEHPSIGPTSYEHLIGLTNGV